MTKHPASALLISFFVMSLLVVVSLGVSLMVLQDTSRMRTVVGGAQARYAAEGMTEQGLKILKDHLPGYESEESYVFSTGAEGELSILAREASVPCSVREAEWRRLSFNESVQLALFAETESGEEKLEDFYVDFYVGDEEGNPTRARDVDVLRWKILGRTADGLTESISEYIPMDENTFTQFGTSAKFSYAKYYALSSNGQSYIFYESYPIKTFIEEHATNYLTLTNVTDEDHYLYVRLNSADATNESTCEYVTLASTADVDFGSARQSVKTVVREGENLPVFDFVLYHTSGKREESDPFEFKFSLENPFK